jgi:hypothetical protein
VQYLTICICFGSVRLVFAGCFNWLAVLWIALCSVLGRNKLISWMKIDLLEVPFEVLSRGNLFIEK